VLDFTELYFHRCLYFVVIVVVLPLLIVNLWKSGKYTIKFEVWIIGGLFTILAVPISLWDITQHLVHYNKPHMQKYIIRYKLKKKNSKLYLQLVTFISTDI